MEAIRRARENGIRARENGIDRLNDVEQNRKEFDVAPSTELERLRGLLKASSSNYVAPGATVNVPHPRNQEILEAGIESCLRIIAGAEEGKEEAVFSEWAGHAIRHAYEAGWEKTDIIDRLDNAGEAIGLDADIRQRILSEAILRVEGAETSGEILAGMEHIDTAVQPESAPNSRTTAIDFQPYHFPDPASIPPREWLYGKHYIRGAISASIGAPGRAKSTTSLIEIISMVVGRDLMTGEPLPSGPLRGAYFNGEEVQEELDRRVAAICQRFDVKPEDCGDRLYVESTRDKPIKVALLGPRGNAIVSNDMVTALKEWCDTRQIDVLAIDPLISFHSVRENDNSDMDLVIKEAFGAIAGKARSVDTVHHPRKLVPGESNTSVDDARGASAILAAVRVARTFNFMTRTEAEQLGIHEDDRRLHVRVENGKASMGPIGTAKWIKIVTENLPNGDTVACVESWTQPNPFDGVSVADLKVVQRLVQGGAFRADSQSPNWLGWWMAEKLPGLNITARHDDKPRDKAAVARLNSILKTWVKNKVLRIVDGEDDKRRPKKFYAVDEPVGDVSIAKIEPGDEE